MFGEFKMTVRLTDIVKREIVAMAEDKGVSTPFLGMSLLPRTIGKLESKGVELAEQQEVRCRVVGYDERKFGAVIVNGKSPEDRYCALWEKSEGSVGTYRGYVKL